MNKRLAAAVVALLGISVATPVRAAGASLHVGAAYVTKSGSGPHAVILLPGLGFGAFVFDGIAPSLAKRYTVYAVTFAGMDGEPPVGAPYLVAYADSIMQLIAKEHLDRPVLIGHSMGGHLALRIAGTYPDRIGGAVVIDALPLFPPLRSGDTLVERSTALAGVPQVMSAMSQAQWDAQARATTVSMVTDPATVETFLQHEALSDRGTIGGVFVEMSLTDLHPLLPKITVPVLVLAAVPNTDQTDLIRAYFSDEYKTTPHVTIQPVAPSKHFIMQDQPAVFASAVENFLAKVMP